MRSALRTAAFVGVTLLSACGGGGGVDAVTPGPGPGPGPGPDTVATTKVSGIVAVGAPLVGATITSLCGDGSDGPTTTSADLGQFILEMTRACPGPWIVKATSADGTKTLFSLGGDKPADAPAPKEVHINVTPVTKVVLEAVLVEGLSGETSFDPLRSRWREIDPTKMREAMEAILQALNALRPAGTPELTLADILSKPFDPRPGDPMDDLLEYVQANRGAVPFAALLERVQKAGGDMESGQPWKTLFRDGSSLTWSRTARCRAAARARPP